MRFLSRGALEALQISMAEVVACMEQLVLTQQQGRAWVAPKTKLVTGDERFMMATLAAADDPPFMAVKALMENAANAKRGLSALNSSITLLDSSSGVAVAAMDGNWVTALRTAGASAMVARRLANAEAKVLALIGCGVQARSHLKGFAELYPLTEVRAYGRGGHSRDALCQLATEMGLKAVASDCARDAVEDADIVISSIPMLPRVEPFLDANWLKPGVFVSSTDLALPWKPESLDAFDRIVIDDRELEASMSEPMLKASLIDGDVGELLSGKVSGRAEETERTAFVFRSAPLGDLAVAALALKKAGADWEPVS